MICIKQNQTKQKLSKSKILFWGGWFSHGFIIGILLASEVFGVWVALGAWFIPPFANYIWETFSKNKI
jgi:hypothetical protein